MKLFKKFGIGFLALIICVCSCFKFVNAEALEEPFTLEIENTYVFVISNDYIDQTDVLIASSNNSGGVEPYTEIVYAINKLTFHTEYNGITTSVDAPLAFIEQDSNYSYYMFAYNINTDQYIYEDIEIYYFETYENDNFSVYNSIYALIENYLFGGDIPTNSYQELTATLLSGTICIFVFALPFLIVWKTIRIIMG